MRDVRLSALRRAVEARWPGTRVVWEAYRSPENPEIRGWIYVLYAPEGRWFEVQHFALDLAWALFPSPFPFFVTAVEPEHEAEIQRQFGLPPRSKQVGRRRSSRSGRRAASASARTKSRGSRGRSAANRKSHPASQS